MTRKIIFIIAGALLFLALLFLLWFWLLNRAPEAKPQGTGSFATSTDKGAEEDEIYEVGQDEFGAYVMAGPIEPGRYLINDSVDGRSLGAYSLSPDADGRIRIGNGPMLPPGRYRFAPIAINTGSGGVSDTQSGTASSTGTATSTTTAAGGVTSNSWIGSNAPVRDFNATQINQINSTAGLTGAPVIATTPQPASLGVSGVIIGAAAAGCLAQYLVHEGAALIQANAQDRFTALSGGPYVAVLDLNASAKLNNTKFKSVEECLVKTIAKAAIDQITRSVVNWINSGFNGSPSFVTNFNQYFANVADQAAGEFIKGSALSFLCSPFAPQIKIAIAQSYANRNNSGASCSLSKVTNNINGFMSGRWANGGWGGLLQFTTVPTNNPYGAYAYAQAGLNSSIANAQNNAKSHVSAGGFISLQKCDPAKGQSVAKGNCTVTTPGAIIEESLKKTVVNTPLDGLNLAQNVNEIITALTNQVMIKTLYGGLGGSLGGITNPLAPAIDQAASAQAQTLLGQLQAQLTYAGQFASVQQGSIRDIQGAQSRLNDAYNCWIAAASSSPSTADAATAMDKASELNAAQLTLEARIDSYNGEITRSNAALAAIQNLQSQVYFAATPGDLTTAAQAVNAAVAQGVFISQADITTAQQNRAALQTELTARNQATQASMDECRIANGRI